MEERTTPLKEGELDEPLPPKMGTPEESTTTLPNNDLPKSPQPHDSKLGPSGTQKSANTLEDANNELARLKREGLVTVEDVSITSAVLKEHASLKDKVEKLKSLLGRSAKAQRETKVDFEATQKRLNQALREIERLNQKLDKLQNRPTHCKLGIFVPVMVCVTEISHTT
jgi:uncharacterized phage infection (PIP) family protein YhgE